MRKLLVALASLPDSKTISRFSERVANAGFKAIFIVAQDPLKAQLEEHCSIDQDCVLLISGVLVKDALLASLNLGGIEAIIAVNPEWSHDLGPVLSSVVTRVIIVTDGPELSSSRMQAMKYHDRISGSTINYLRLDAVKTLLDHPERMIKMLEDGLDAR